MLGSPLGSTSAASGNPLTGQRYGLSFPQVTPADQAVVHYQLMQRLGISHVHAVVGASMGGMQALQFARLFPDAVRRLVAVATTARTSPMSVAIRHAQRSAIMADPAFKGGRYWDPTTPGGATPGPLAGLGVARQIGMMAYRSREEFDARFNWDVTGAPNMPHNAFEVESYLSYQGRKFAPQFDANCYLQLSRAMDLQNIAAGHPAVPGSDPGPEGFAGAALRMQCAGLLVGVRQDALIPEGELALLADVFAQAGRGDAMRFVSLGSRYGHDSFLHEYDALGALVQEHLTAGLDRQLLEEARHTTGLSAP